MRCGFGRVADLKAHAEFVGAVVEEKDGEDAVGNDGANKLGGAIEEGLQVERGVERVGHLGEVTRGRSVSMRAFCGSIWACGLSGSAGR